MSRMKLREKPGFGSFVVISLGVAPVFLAAGIADGIISFIILKEGIDEKQ